MWSDFDTEVAKCDTACCDRPFLLSATATF